MKLEIKPMKKKGFALGDLLPIALLFVTTGIAIAYGLQVLSDVKGDMTADSYEANATQDTIEAVAKFSGKLGLLVTIVIAAIVLVILFRYLGGSASGGRK